MHKAITYKMIFIYICWLSISCGCVSTTQEPDQPPTQMITLVENKTPAEPRLTTSSLPVAGVISVEVSGPPGAYQFLVGVRSPDLGCEQYADWWEVINEQGELLYRRILQHSHVDEQPFTRSGGPVPIDIDETVIVRAHMHPTGYGGAALKGSVETGFQQIDLDADFATSLENMPPLPGSCAF